LHRFASILGLISIVLSSGAGSLGRVQVCVAPDRTIPAGGSDWCCEDHHDEGDDASDASDSLTTVPPACPCCIELPAATEADYPSVTRAKTPIDDQLDAIALPSIWRASETSIVRPTPPSAGEPASPALAHVRTVVLRL
jgi:hypothetical protein